MASELTAPNTQAQQTRVLALLKQYGWNATSFQILEPGYSYFFREPKAGDAGEIPNIGEGGDACVAYVDTGSSWVAAGAPIAPESELAAVADAFIAAAHLALERLIGRWLGTRQMAPMGFLVQLNLFTEAAERRCLLAEVDGQLVGVLGMIPVYARGGLLRFGIETLLRGPAVIVRLLAALLLPWTLLLALAPARYFPSPAVKGAWVLFDVALAAALLHVTYVWRPWLATLLTGLVTCDAALTLVQALSYNLPRQNGAVDLLMIATAVAGPALSAFLLWRARPHRQQQ